MFDFDSARTVFYGEGIDNGSLIPDFDQEQESASDRLARQLTGVAVNKIASEPVRRRARFLVAPKVASRVSINDRHRNDGEALGSANEAWMRFATVQLETAHLLKLVSGHGRVTKTTISPIPVIGLVGELAEPMVELDLRSVEAEAAPEPRTIEESEPVVRSFEVKPELISAWLEGLNAVRAEGGHAALLPLSSHTEEKYAAELTRQLRKIISNFAKRKAYEGGAYRITFAGKFLPSIESLLEDHLMLPPRNAVQFLDIFKGELYRQSSGQAVFSGRWGELTVDDASELVLNLQKRRSRRLAAVLKGK